MEFQQWTNSAGGIVGSASKIIDKLAGTIANITSIQQSTLYDMVVLVIAIIIADIFTRRGSKLSITYWLMVVGGFVGLKWLGL